jgi:hypothetical protein
MSVGVALDGLVLVGGPVGVRVVFRLRVVVPRGSGECVTASSVRFKVNAMYRIPNGLLKTVGWLCKGYGVLIEAWQAATVVAHVLIAACNGGVWGYQSVNFTSRWVLEVPTLTWVVSISCFGDARYPRHSGISAYTRHVLDVLQDVHNCDRLSHDVVPRLVLRLESRRAQVHFTAISFHPAFSFHPMSFLLKLSCQRGPHNINFCCCMETSVCNGMILTRHPYRHPCTSCDTGNA